MKNVEMNVETRPIEVNLGNPLVKKEFELIGKIFELEDYITGLDLDNSELVRLLTTVVKNVSDKKPGGSKYDKKSSIMSGVVENLITQDSSIFDYDLFKFDLLKEYVYYGVGKENKVKYEMILEIEKNEGINVFRTLYYEIEGRDINPMYIELNKVEYQLGGEFLTYMGCDTSIDPNNEDYEEFESEDYVVEFLKEFSEWNRNRQIEKVIGVVGPGGGLYK